MSLQFNFFVTLSRVKNQTSILSLFQSWLVLLLWLLTSFQWFLVPVLLHYSNQCSGSEVSISFLNFIPQGAGSCVWFHCQEWSPSQLHSRGNQSSGNTVMLYRFYPAPVQGWTRSVFLFISLSTKFLANVFTQPITKYQTGLIFCISAI